jgi:dipeptidyl aminopeptidase/acylaminoacyl peptidase
MTSVKKNSLLNRRSLCASGMGVAVLTLAGCGGGGGGGSGGSDAGNSANTNTAFTKTGLSGTLYLSNIDQMLKVDLSNGKSTEVRFRNADTPAGTTYRISEKYFDLSLDNKTLFFMDELGTERLAAVDLASNLATTVFKVNRAFDWAEIRRSPDGQKFAMVKEFGSGGFGVYIYDYLGKQIAYFAKAQNQVSNSIAWTSDNRLLFTDDGIYMTDPGDLKNATQISSVIPTSISLNPAGDKIAYAKQSHLWTMGITGANAQQITTSDNAELRPRWSPDGKYIIFKSLVKVISGGSIPLNRDLYQLVVIPADGKQYALKSGDTFSAPPRTGGTRGTLGGDGVVLLKYEKEPGYFPDIIADDMIWR